MNIFQKLFGRKDKKGKMPEKTFPIQRRAFPAGGKSSSSSGYKSNRDDDYPIPILPFTVYSNDTPSIQSPDDNSFNGFGGGDSGGAGASGDWGSSSNDNSSYDSGGSYDSGSSDSSSCDSSSSSSD
jgi:hypothetical protein